MSKITTGLELRDPRAQEMARNMPTGRAVGAKLIEEAGYDFRKESVPGMQQGDKVRLQRGREGSSSMPQVQRLFGSGEPPSRNVRL